MKENECLVSKVNDLGFGYGIHKEPQSELEEQLSNKDPKFNQLREEKEGLHVRSCDLEKTNYRQRG